MTSKLHHLSTPGQKFQHFNLDKITEIPGLQCQMLEFTHEPSGAQVIHIANDDPENLFCLSFKTIPSSSNGVAHILEHTVLCGSKKFPIKDPFFAMSRRSLNTFMNALTGADFTCYPAASQVPQDFYNLLDVYIDAVFHPLLNPFSFHQEGHRIEFANPNDSSSRLEYKGIVYNEMKGAMASQNARLSEALHSALFPDVTYGVNSGGDPKVIPQLTYQELCDFHKTYYHPSQCLFFFYGNMPIEGHLEFIAKEILDASPKMDPLPSIPLQPRFKTPRYFEQTYPISPDESDDNKALISFGWLTCSILEQDKVIALSVLEIILMGNDASPLKMALLKSQLCKQASSFLDEELNEIPWGINLKGCDPENADAIEQLIIETLKEVIKTGITLESVENAIHQLEFYRSEIGGNHHPFGLSLFMRSALLKQHGANPESGLIIHLLFRELYERVLANPNYLAGFIQETLLDNPHYVRIIMRPDKSLTAKESKEEEETLKKIKGGLSKSQIAQLIKLAADLSQFQKDQEECDISVLPKILVKDIPLFSREYALHQEKLGPLQIYHHPVFTNDIIYANLTWDLPDLPVEDLPFLTLLTIVLTQIGSNGRNYKENLEYIQGHTGGIGAGVSLNIQANNSTQYRPTFHLKGKALHRKANKLFPLIIDTLLTPDFTDTARLKEILTKHFSGLESQLTQNSLKYAVNLSASGISSAASMANQLYGLPYFWKIQQLMKDFDTEASYIREKLISIHQKIIQWGDLNLVLSCDAIIYNQLKGHDFYGLSQLELYPSPIWKNDLTVSPVESQGRVIASPVAFIAKAFSTVSYTHPDAPALSIASYLFDNLTLHSLIREQGGAYGGGAVNNSTSGNFYFYSYRDPNISSSLIAFDKAVEEVCSGYFEESDIEEAKMELIQALDSPVAPGSQADLSYGYFLEGKSPAMRQAFRDKMLKLTKEEIIKAVHSHIANKIGEGAGIVFASRGLLEKENMVLNSIKKTPLPIISI
jgi:presequence protease